MWCPGTDESVPGLKAFSSAQVLLRLWGRQACRRWGAEGRRPEWRGFSESVVRDIIEKVVRGLEDFDKSVGFNVRETESDG